MNTRRSACVLIGLMAAWLPAVVAPESHLALAEGPPNVIIITLDDARVDDMGVMASAVGEIGGAGVKFTEAVSSFPLCCPARASLLTGQYPHNHRVLSNAAPLGGFAKFDDASTLATWLDPEYETALIGKYLNQYKAPYVPPGWDYWASPKAYYTYTYAPWSVNGTSKSYPGNQTDTIGDLSSQFIRANSDPGDEPFFLYANIVAPHAGLPAETDDPGFPTPFVGDKYRDTFKGKPLTDDPSFNEADISDKPVQPAPLSSAERVELIEVSAQRQESLLHARDAIDKIIDTLAATGELGNTYVWLVSDNGYILGEHRIRGGKLAPYEVSVHIPMMLRGPGIPAGAAVRQQVGLIDIAPTVLAMTGHPARATIDGINLLPLIGNPGEGADRPLLIEAGPASDTAPDTDPYRYHGIIQNDWKYVVRKSGQKELYDLAADPYELENVAGKADYATTQRRLHDLLLERRWCRGSACR